jgi:hypothetical protein
VSSRSRRSAENSATFQPGLASLSIAGDSLKPSSAKNAAFGSSLVNAEY